MIKSTRNCLFFRKFTQLSNAPTIWDQDAFMLLQNQIIALLFFWEKSKMRVHMYVGWVFFKMVPRKKNSSCISFCESVMETTYASKTNDLPDVCYYCGGRSVSPLYNNAKIKQLKKKYTKVQRFAQVVLLMEKNL